MIQHFSKKNNMKSKKNEKMENRTKKTEQGQRGLERKISAEEREAYKGTQSDETEIEKQNFPKMKKIR